jgi:hypothetical protein
LELKITNLMQLFTHYKRRENQHLRDLESGVVVWEGEGEGEGERRQREKREEGGCSSRITVDRMLGSSPGISMSGERKSTHSRDLRDSKGHSPLGKVWGRRSLTM